MSASEYYPKTMVLKIGLTPALFLKAPLQIPTTNCLRGAFANFGFAPSPPPRGRLRGIPPAPFGASRMRGSKNENAPVSKNNAEIELLLSYLL
jgi:hypothetical protein